MTENPTALSLAGAGVYVLVSVLCVLAWAKGRGGSEGGAQRRSGWLAIAALFVCLAVSRALVIEDRFDNFMRDLARESGAYDGRTAWQGPLSLMAVLLVLLAFALLVRTWVRSRGEWRRQALGIAQLASFAMLGLIALRMISLHAVDSLLYGGLRLNWWLDIGLSLLVGAAAWIGWKAPRN